MISIVHLLSQYIFFVFEKSSLPPLVDVLSSSYYQRPSLVTIRPLQVGRSAEEVAARRPPSSPDSACKRRPRPHRQGEEGGAGAIQSGKGRVLLPNRVPKGVGGHFQSKNLYCILWTFKQGYPDQKGRNATL